LYRLTPQPRDPFQIRQLLERSCRLALNRDGAGQSRAYTGQAIQFDLAGRIRVDLLAWGQWLAAPLRLSIQRFRHRQGRVDGSGSVQPGHLHVGSSRQQQPPTQRCQDDE
jgi:hypothetical protein